MVGKEALILCIDVSVHMSGGSLESVIYLASCVAERKIYNESKDEIAIILFGCAVTDNQLADGSSYEGIRVTHPLQPPSFEFIRFIKNNIMVCNSTEADFLDVLVVASDLLYQKRLQFPSKRIFLFSTLGATFDSGSVATIVNALKNENIEVAIIGPTEEEPDREHEPQGDEPGPSNSRSNAPHQKPKTEQQRIADRLLETEFESIASVYSFDEVVNVFSFLQSKEVKPTPWKVNLSLAGLEIPVLRYVASKEVKTKSWRKTTHVGGDDDKIVISKSFYVLEDGKEKEISDEKIIKGYRYGTSLIPINENDEAEMKFRDSKCFQAMGFTPASNVSPGMYTGEGSFIIKASPADESSALSAFIWACHDYDLVMIVRYCYSSASTPCLMGLVPRIEEHIEYFVGVSLPCADDIRLFPLPSLDSYKGLEPSNEQLQKVDNLITAMDLESEEFKEYELYSPENTYNPYIQHFYSCLTARVLDKNSSVENVNRLFVDAISPSPLVTNASQRQQLELKDAFTLKKIEVKKEKSKPDFGGDLLNKDGDQGPSSKRIKVDHEANLDDVFISSTNPVEDFHIYSQSVDEKTFEKACELLISQIGQFINNSFTNESFPKAIQCIVALRDTCLKRQRIHFFNTFLSTYKDELLAGPKANFFNDICNEKISLISSSECSSSTVTDDEALKFILPSVVSQSVEVKDEADDLLDDLI